MTNVATSGASIAAAVASDPSMLETPPQVFTPISGDNCVLSDNAMNGTAYIDPAGALVALTITLPTDAKSRVGQQREILITRAITTLTITGATSIVNTITTCIANTWISVRKVSANKWVVRAS